jgi:nicotinic acid phosphoribosyltransferase
MAEVRKIPILHVLKFFIQHCVCQFCYIVTRAAGSLEAPNDEAIMEFGLRRQASAIHTTNRRNKRRRTKEKRRRI